MGVVAHDFNSHTQRQRQEDLCESKKFTRVYQSGLQRVPGKLRIHSEALSQRKKLTCTLTWMSPEDKASESSWLLKGTCYIVLSI